MPRNGSGIYTAPTGTYGVSGTPISATAYDGFINDLSTELTNSVNVQGTAPMLASLNMGGYTIINAGTPVAATDVATKGYVDGGIPSGLIMAYAMDVGAPSGWLNCNGASISTITYPGLFAVLAYSYGGSGTSFNVPDFRGCFLRGWDNARGIDYQGTRAVNQFQATAIINHFHTLAQTPHVHGISDPGHTHGQSPHNHGVTDPTHNHSVPNGSIGNGVNLAAGSGFNLVNANATGFSATGISIQGANANLSAAVTGVTDQAQYANVVVESVSTGTVAAETTVANYPILWCIKT